MNLRAKFVKLVRLLMNSPYRAGLLRGVAAGVEHEKILQTLNCDVVLDVGANKGQFTLAVRRNIPAARVFAFEPMHKAATVFDAVHSNDPHVVLLHGAVGEADETMQMNISARQDSSSLLPISARQNEIFPGTNSVGVETVIVKPLTHWISSDVITGNTLLKIDVQGYELEVLRGCVDVLNKIKYVYVECSFVELYAGQAMAWEVIDYMSKHGFYLAGIYNVSYDKDGVAIQADFLYRKLDV